MKPIDLLNHLNHLGAKLVIKDGRLRCDAPKDAIGPDLLAMIKANKASLMALIDEDARNEAGYNEPKIRAIQRGKAHPLSYAQKRMLVLHEMQLDEGVFNIGIAFELNGPLDIPLLEEALKYVVDRHELLRTRFTSINDEPAQLIEQEPALSLNRIDLYRVEGADHESLAWKVVDQGLKRPFDIYRSPLFRAVLVCRKNNDFILLLVSHYLVADEKSMSVIFRELCDYYNGASADALSDGKRRFQYVDYVAWETAFLNSPAGQSQLRYWSERFSKLAAFEKNHNQSADQSMRIFTADNLAFKISVNETEMLGKLSRAQNTSLFMVCCAIFTLLVAAVYKRYRFCCATPIVNRGRMELENMIGYFANTLILECALSDDMAFADYLGAMRTETLQAFSHGDIPFELVLEKAGIAAGPLTRFMFTYREDDPVLPQFNRLLASPLKLHESMSQNVVAELSISICRADTELVCSLFYARDLFDSGIIECLPRDFRATAEAIVNSPRTTIGDLIRACESTRQRQDGTDKLVVVKALESRSVQAAAYMAPRNDQERMLVNIWRDILDIEQIGTADNFFFLGGNSFQAVKMFTALYRKTGIKLPISCLFQSPTIELLAKTIDCWERDPPWSPIVPIRAGGDRPPLFFVHGAGGNVLLYRDLGIRLSPEQPFYGIQSKGLDGRAELLTTVEVMADYYVKEIRKIQPDGPYFLGGYCLGGQIAYEMARNLSASGNVVAFVGLLDTQRRWNADHGFVLRLRHQCQQIAFHFRNFLLADFKGKLSFFKEKAMESFRRTRRRLLVYLSIAAFALKLRKDRPLVVMEHVNDLAAQRYVALPYNGTITLFRPQRNYIGYEDPLMGWGGGLTRGVEVHNLSMFPAGMLVEPFVDELAEKLQKVLDRLHKTAA